jgi:hypothetical protein
MLKLILPALNFPGPSSNLTFKEVKERLDMIKIKMRKQRVVGSDLERRNLFRSL